MEHVFGGWPNFTQGAAGAMLGVLGAYAVAVLTSKREIRRDRERSEEERSRERERAREGAAHLAAGQLIRPLFDLAAHVKQIKHLEWSHESSGLDPRHLTAWENRREDFKRDVAETGVLLPPALEGKATRLIGRLGDVMVADFDDEGWPYMIDAGNVADLDAVIEAAEALVDDLQAFRRDPSSFAQAD